MTSSADDTPKGELILYQTEDGRTRIECRFEDESVWLTQALMAQLFNIGVGTVNHHLKEIYAEGELSPEATIRRHRIVRTEGNRSISREIEHYNLENTNGKRNSTCIAAETPRTRVGRPSPRAVRARSADHSDVYQVRADLARRVSGGYRSSRDSLP